MANTSITAKASAASNPTVRYVYLVQDASDALKMGGTLQNTYTTFQTAYNAANALQTSLGSTNIVVIKVGNITSAVAGNLTLTAAYNTRVHIVGLSRFQSVLGNIIGDNAVGSGFSFGGSTLLRVTLVNVTIGTVTTKATGATGNSGQINLQLTDAAVGTLSTNITNVGNLTGPGGNVNITGVTYVVGNITTTATPGAAVAAGNVVAISLGNTGQIGTVTTANGNTSGSVSIVNMASVGEINVTQAATSTGFVTCTNINTLSNLNLNLDDGRAVNINRCNSGAISINNIGALATPITVNIVESIIGNYSQGDWNHANLFMRNSTCTDSMLLLSRFSQIYDSTIQGCIFDIEAQTYSPFQAFKLKNCVLVGDPNLGVTYTMNNLSSGIAYAAYYEDDNNTYVRSTVGVLPITRALVSPGGRIGELPGTPNFVWDTSMIQTAYLDIVAGGATNYTLTEPIGAWMGLGKKFTLWIRSGSNSGTFTFSLFSGAVKFPGGTVWTPSAGATRLDRLEFQMEGAGLCLVTPTLDYK